MMRKTVIALTLATFAFAVACQGQTGGKDARVAYVLQNIGVNRDTQKKLSPLLYDYLAEKKKAGDEYSALKAKLKSVISNGTLTDAQASNLLAKKWEAEAKETAVKKKYTEKFKTVLSAKKTYRCFDLLNDSKSKVQGKAKGKAKGGEKDEDDD